jgi:hypothetical protein
MAWVDGEAFRLLLPALTDVRIGCKPLKRFEPLREVIGHQEGMQLLFQVDMSLVVIRFHWSRFERAVHPFHLAIGPGMVGFGQPMVDTMLMTDTIKAMVKGVDVAFTVRELTAMIGEHRVDLLGHSSHHVPEELSGHHCVGFGVQLGISKLAGAVDRDK